jgi:hypothetical protein
MPETSVTTPTDAVNENVHVRESAQNVNGVQR